MPAETVEQFAGQREKMMTKFDVNGDGELDQAERNAAKQTVPKAMQQKLKGQRMQAIKGAFDTNGDGTLDQAERQAAKEALPEAVVEKF